jgi:hypothetical protein
MSDTVDGRKEILDTADAAGAKGLVDFVAPALDDFADQVWCFGLGATPDERKALGLVAQMGAEMMLGAAAMYEATKLYAGSSLVRQLIEVDYLLFLFGMDSAEASRWLKGSAAEHKELFQPAPMRKRAGSRFDVDEYSRHCEMGGHPRPMARALVDRHHIATSDPSALLWEDLANHVVRVWDHYKVAAATCSPTNVYPDRWKPIDVACQTWWDSNRAHRKLVAGIAAQQGVAADGAAPRS